MLIDLISWFSPEPGFEVVETPGGPRQLGQLVRDEIARLERSIEQIEASTTSPKVQRLAVALLSDLAERRPN